MKLIPSAELYRPVHVAKVGANKLNQRPKLLHQFSQEHPFLLKQLNEEWLKQLTKRWTGQKLEKISYRLFKDIKDPQRFQLAQFGFIVFSSQVIYFAKILSVGLLIGIGICKLFQKGKNSLSREL